MKKLLLTFILGATVTIAAQAQAKHTPSETATIEAITETGLKIISGPKGQQRDMEKFKALFCQVHKWAACFLKATAALCG